MDTKIGDRVFFYEVGRVDIWTMTYSYKNMNGEAKPDVN